MHGPNRRRFLSATAAAAAGGTVLTAGRSPADGPAYAVQGIDVSHWQGTVNWAGVRTAGIRFAFCKATEGLTYTDPTFATNWAGMAAAGILRGAYHFGRPASDPVAQAKRFINTVKPKSGDLQLVLDLEATDGMTPSQVRAWTVAFVDTVRRGTGRPAIIYTGFYFWRDSAGNGSNLNCPLWLAAYTTSPAGLIPAAWSTWSLWQYTSSGSVSGVTGNVDRNAWNGTLTGLKNLRLP